MEKFFRINKSFVWILIFISIFALIEAVYINFFNEKTAFFSIGIISFLYLFFIILSDILSHTVYNKTFWIISLFILSYPTIIVYLIRREHLIKFGEKMLQKQNRK